MASRTFLQLVNDVLRELREPEVATWDQSDYSTLIGTYVNSAKRDVENAWTWDALRETFSVTCVDGTVTYAFTGTNDRARVLDGWNYTQGTQLVEYTWRYMNQLYFGNSGGNVTEGNVSGYVLNGVDVSEQTQVDVYPIPDNSTDVLKFTVYNPPSDFTLDADECIIPHRPIVETALARARGERGEDGGISTSEQAAFAMRAAADAIALDAARHPEDTTWEAV